MDTAPPTTATLDLDSRIITLVSEAIRRVGRFGTIEITIHEGAVQSIEERRRTRLQQK